MIQDQSWESIKLKEKLEIARRAVDAKRESPKEAGARPPFDRENRSDGSNKYVGSSEDFLKKK